MERHTRQRDAVLSAFAGGDTALSPIEICQLAQREVPRLGLSTVYRLVKDLLDTGELARVDLPGQPPRYEAVAQVRGASGDGHHHHFHCNRCDRVFQIQGCPGPMKQLAPKGFRVEGHEITLHGRCPPCAAAGAPR